MRRVHREMPHQGDERVRDGDVEAEGDVHPFPQAVLGIPVIDRNACPKYVKDMSKCGLCAKVCGPQCIDFDQKDTFETVSVGAIVVATGYDVMPAENFPEFSGGKSKDVITGLHFERLASASGPTGGEIKRPSDGKVPETVVFIECSGSRDERRGVSYCSAICCMYSAKHAMLYKHKAHHGQAYIFYMDIRCGGKRYEEFHRRAVEQEGRSTSVAGSRGSIRATAVSWSRGRTR